MKVLGSVVEFVSGTPQFRIKEVFDDTAPLYYYYSQQYIEDDLTRTFSDYSNSKQVKTLDKVNTLCQGDIIFSLLSGKSTIVSVRYHGYLYTQNYVKLVADKKIDSKYLVFLLNEDKFIKRQLQIGLQGSQVLKHTLKQVKELELPELPVIEKQQIIGELYFNQLRLEALKNRVMKSETIIVLEKLREVGSK